LSQPLSWWQTERPTGGREACLQQWQHKKVEEKKATMLSSFLRMWCALPRSRSRAGAAVDDGSAGGFLLLFALLWKFKLCHRLPRLDLVDFCNAII
jgi:hypothetical protein